MSVSDDDAQLEWRVRAKSSGTKQIKCRYCGSNLAPVTGLVEGPTEGRMAQMRRLFQDVTVRPDTTPDRIRLAVAEDPECPFEMAKVLFGPLDLLPNGVEPLFCG